MGGQIAMEFARAHPERVTGLVFAATFARAETPAGIELRHRTADEIIERGMALHGCELLPKLVGHTSMKAQPQVASFVYEMIASTPPSGAAAALRGRAKRRDYTPHLQSFDVPALIVVGTEDAFTDVDEAASMRARMPQATLEIFERVGHLPNLEAPAQFNLLLESFLEVVYGVASE
jgi:pimeloyl-ACP methyl ester carboxylesterase